MNEYPVGQSELTIVPEQSGLRLDQVLAHVWPNQSRTFFQKCITQGLVLVNASSCTSSQRLKNGDLVCVHWPELVETTLHGEDIPLDILLEDQYILLLNKQAGLVVHPGSGNPTGTLVQGLLYHNEGAFSEMNAEDLRPGIVHRLDKDTSGVLVVAKTPRAEAALKQSFKTHCTEKTYLAIAIGTFQQASGIIEGAIGRNPQHRQKMKVLAAGGKEATSKYRVLANAGDCTLLAVRILTGRTHQIRVHLASIQHPILGDPLYGGRPSRLPFLPARQMLHAWKLNFPHPETGEMIRCTAPLPGDFQQALQVLGLPLPEPNMA